MVFSFITDLSLHRESKTTFLLCLCSNEVYEAGWEMPKLGMTRSVGPPFWSNISKTFRWIAPKFCSDICGSQRTKPSKFGEFSSIIKDRLGNLGETSKISDQMKDYLDLLQACNSHRYQTVFSQSIRFIDCCRDEKIKCFWNVVKILLCPILSKTDIPISLGCALCSAIVHEY